MRIAPLCASLHCTAFVAGVYSYCYRHDTVRNIPQKRCELTLCQYLHRVIASVRMFGIGCRNTYTSFTEKLIHPPALFCKGDLSKFITLKISGTCIASFSGLVNVHLNNFLDRHFPWVHPVKMQSGPRLGYLGYIHDCHAKVQDWFGSTRAGPAAYRAKSSVKALEMGSIHLSKYFGC
jgi:hypothetical protein